MTPGLWVLAVRLVRPWGWFVEVDSLVLGFLLALEPGVPECIPSGFVALDYWGDEPGDEGFIGRDGAPCSLDELYYLMSAVSHLPVRRGTPAPPTSVERRPDCNGVSDCIQSGGLAPSGVMGSLSWCARTLLRGRDLRLFRLDPQEGFGDETSPTGPGKSGLFEGNLAERAWLVWLGEYGLRAERQDRQLDDTDVRWHYSVVVGLCREGPSDGDRQGLEHGSGQRRIGCADAGDDVEPSNCKSCGPPTATATVSVPILPLLGLSRP